MMTPKLMAGVDVHPKEFGQLVESEIFGMSVDWVKTSAYGQLSSKYQNDLLEAIEENKNIPPLPIDTKFEARRYVVMHGGADFDWTVTGLEIA